MMQVTRLFEIVDRQLELFPKKDSLNSKLNGQWINVSTEELKEQADWISYGLLALGIQPGDTIGTISNNRPEWNMVDIGMMQAGAIHVPIYPTISESDLIYILNDARVKYIFVSSPDLAAKAKNCSKDVSSLKEIFSFNPVEGVKSWNEVLDLGKKNKDENKLKEVKSRIDAHSLATLLYTSGTTGKPKGVMISHDNLVSNVIACEPLCPVDHTGRALSFLPLNHVYERMLTYLYIYRGVSIYYAESMETIGDNLREVKPDLFSCVPRLLEKVYDRIISKGAELKGIKKKLFYWALNLGLKYELYGKNGWWYETQLKLANKIIFNKWREALGGRVKVAVSGGAALNPKLARVFWAAQIPVLEGYGLTETAVVIAVNLPEDDLARFGTVGTVISNVQVKIAEDGEILCKGPNIMMGYYKKPQETAEVLDADGWFHTGDIGTIEDGKFLKITDRKKEIFKTSGGKYITPQMIENKLKESRFIEQCMVVGENQKFASALIVPAFAFIKEWGARKGIVFNSNEEMSKNKEVRDRIREEIDLVNKALASYETIKKFELLPREWSIDKSELTPKLSLRRKVILAENQSTIEKIYANLQDGKI